MEQADYKDLHNAMIENKEAKFLEAIAIKQYPKESMETTLKVDAISKMNHLKLLIHENVTFSGTLNYLSNELRYLSWDEYPFKSLPLSFHPVQLVELILPCSNIKQLWKGAKCLPNLGTLDLRHSKNLIEMPDLSGVPHLEKLTLEGRIKIVQIDPSISILKELTLLNLKYCKNLVLNLNIIFGLNSLEVLELSGCSKILNNEVLKKLRETEHLEKVDKNISAIQLSTSSVYEILMLPFYFLSSRKHLDSLGLWLPCFSRFPCLLYLDLSFCNLLQIPDAIGNLHSLVSLNLGGNKFVTLPNTIKDLSKLRILNLEHCKQLKSLPELPTTKAKGNCLQGLYIFDCPEMSEMEHCYSMVFSWMMHNLEVSLQQPSITLGKMDIVIPGTQIPMWFTKQNASSSISMDPSHVIEDPNLIGVACCVLFVTHDDPSNLGDRSRCQPRDCPCFGFGVQNKQLGCETYFTVPILFKRDLVTVEYHHLLVMFFTFHSSCK